MAGTKAPSALKKYLSQADDLPADVLLGRLVIITISDEPVKHADVLKWMKAFRLDLTYAPAPNRALDAFKKATSSQDGTKYDLSGGRQANVLCRDVNETTMLLRRQITREIRDSKNKVLDYSKARVIDCVFSKPTNPADQSGARLVIQVDKDNLEPGEKKDVQAIGKAIHDKYYRYYEFLDGMKLRATVRGYLKKLNAIEIKGGLYFVQVAYDEELLALAKLVARFGGDCEMSTIPMVDLPRERKYMAGVLQREATEELKKLTAEIRENLAPGKRVNQATVKRLSDRYQEVVENIEEHMATLRLTKNVTAAGAELAQKELAKLQVKALRS